MGWFSSPAHLRLLLSLLLLLLLPIAAAVAQEDEQLDLRLPSAEQEAAYLALESINPSTAWRALYPDDLCLSGPHGVVCDIFQVDNTTGATAAAAHITELNFGYVSDFSSNPACGPNATLPPLLSLPFLRKLFIYECFTEAKVTLPANLWSLSSSLEELVLFQNPSLVGRLNGRIGNFPRLRRLVISGTGISGNVPSEIGRLRNLEQLVLSRNRLRGSIPHDAGRCERLKILDVSGNWLGGRLPAEIGRLGELVKLDLSLNRISGAVPAELAQLKRLELLDLSYNRLTGGVPTALAEMASLRGLYLSGNRLGGRIPEIWKKLGGILGLGMSGMGLVGNIPASMGVFLERVCYLALDNNSLEGELPEELERLERSAGEINLANNALSGQIPFSAGFVGRMGGKLKLGGNPGLCLGPGEDLVGPVRSKGILGYLEPCNKLEIPHPVLSRSGVHLLKCPPTFLALFFISLILVQF